MNPFNQEQARFVQNFPPCGLCERYGCQGDCEPTDDEFAIVALNAKTGLWEEIDHTETKEQAEYLVGEYRQCMPNTPLRIKEKP